MDLEFPHRKPWLKKYTTALKRLCYTVILWGVKSKTMLSGHNALCPLSIVFDLTLQFFIFINDCKQIANTSLLSLAWATGICNICNSTYWGQMSRAWAKQGWKLLIVGYQESFLQLSLTIITLGQTKVRVMNDSQEKFERVKICWKRMGVTVSAWL